MSETSIHAASTTLCCCNEKVAARTLKEYHWLEIAALISVAILVILMPFLSPFAALVLRES